MCVWVHGKLSLITLHLLRMASVQYAILHWAWNMWKISTSLFEKSVFAKIFLASAKICSIGDHVKKSHLSLNKIQHALNYWKDSNNGLILIFFFKYVKCFDLFCYSVFAVPNAVKYHPIYDNSFCYRFVNFPPKRRD